jgi:hypothetical protein
MVNTTYVPNTIRIPRAPIWRENSKSPMEQPVNREGRKKEIEEEEREGGTTLFCPVVALGRLARLLHESRRLTWRDSIAVQWDGASVTPHQSARLSCVKSYGMTEAGVAPRRRPGTRRPHESRQCAWRDSFMSHAKRTSVTRKGKNLKISFVRFIS